MELTTLQQIAEWTQGSCAGSAGITSFSTDSRRMGENCLFIHVTLAPVISSSGEMKTKPTQASVKELQGMGIQPDIIVCRTELPLEKGIKDKIALFCNVPKNNVLQNLDVEHLYEAPLAMEKEHLAEAALRCLHLDCPEPNLTEWEAMINAWKNPEHKVQIALVGKYTQLPDAYLSIIEALHHSGVYFGRHIDIDLIDGENLTAEDVQEVLGTADGILVPGGFGIRGLEGKILAAERARTHKVPFLGICLGLQVAVCEYARHVAGMEDASSTEFVPDCAYPVIDLMPDQEDVTDKGGTMRLGAYPCKVASDTLAHEAYGEDLVYERHRHRYEVNNAYRDELRRRPHGPKCQCSPLVTGSPHVWALCWRTLLRRMRDCGSYSASRTA